jgi:hypothetical protein
MSTFFCKITETNPSPFQGIFLKRNSVTSFALAPLQHKQKPLPAVHKGETKRGRGQVVILAIEDDGGTAVAANFKQSCEESAISQRLHQSTLLVIGRQKWPLLACSCRV